MSRVTSLVIVCVLTAILLAPASYAQLPGLTLRDSSGNGHTLTEDVDGFSLTGSTFGKYGHGVKTGSGSNSLYNADLALAHAGDLSVVVAFNVLELPAPGQQGHIFWSGGSASGGEANNLLGRVYMEDVAGVKVLRYDHQNGPNLFTTITGTIPITTGEHTITLTRNVATNTIVVKLDGVETINSIYVTDPSGGTGATRALRLAGTGPLSHPMFLVFEVRVWDSLKAQSLLDGIADPRNPSYTNTGEGSEEGLYFFENVCSYEGVTQTTNSIAGPVLALGIFGGIIAAIVGAFAFVLRGKAGASWILIGLLLSTIPFNPGAVAQVQPCNITTNQSADALGSFLISLMFALGILALPLIALTAFRRSRG